jgi:molecular chaperone DnaK (HSP70)
MKAKQTIEKEIFQISEADKRNLLEVVEDIKKVLTTPTISEDEIRRLENSITTITSIKDNHLWRLLRAAKQNHMLN